MTPFGEKMRKLRADRAITLKQMSTAIGVSSAYLSALEHGKRGQAGLAPDPAHHRLFQHHLGRGRGGHAPCPHFPSAHYH